MPDLTAITPETARQVVAAAALDDEDAAEHLVGAITRLGAPEKVWVLLRCAYDRPNDSQPPETTVMGVYATEAGLHQRISQIKKANAAKYPLQVTGPHHWRIGPDEDQGVFGDRDYRLWAIQARLGT